MQQPIRVLYRFLRKFFGKVDFQDSSKKYLFSRQIFSLLKRDGHQTSFDLNLPLILSYICFSFSIFLTFTLSDFLSLALSISLSLSTSSFGQQKASAHLHTDICFQRRSSKFSITAFICVKNLFYAFSLLTAARQSIFLGKFLFGFQAVIS